MNKLIKLSLILIVLLKGGFISQSFADEDDIRYYDVEIIVFQNTQPKYLQSEYWKKSFTQIEPETYVQIGQPLPIEFPTQYDPLLSFQFLENTAYRLNDIVTNLNESNNHKVLLHSAWRQPGLSQSEAISVKIHHLIPPENIIIDEVSETQINTDENSNIIPNEDFNTFSINSSFNTTSESLINQQDKGFVLSGYIKLILSRYLHLKIDLAYHAQANEIAEQIISSEFGEDDSLPDVFYISQTRRLRSKELHYIDHPVISIITLITPYKVKE